MTPLTSLTPDLPFAALNWKLAVLVAIRVPMEEDPVEERPRPHFPPYILEQFPTVIAATGLNLWPIRCAARSSQARERDAVRIPE
jgi:hypothetical protein